MARRDAIRGSMFDDYYRSIRERAVESLLLALISLRSYRRSFVEELDKSGVIKKLYEK
jgi:hypothetical protein